IEQVSPERFQVGTALIQLTHSTQGGGGIFVKNRADYFKNPAAASDAENSGYLTLPDPATQGSNGGLQHSLPIAHTATGLTRQQRQGIIFELGALACRQLPQPVANDD